jgi:hypothetical protein
MRAAAVSALPAAQVYRWPWTMHQISWPFVHTVSPVFTEITAYWSEAVV